MAQLQLVQAVTSNGLWTRLRTAWDKQLQQHRSPVDWASPYLDHAEKIVKEDGADKRYAIYVACGGSDPSRPVAPYEGFVHVNFKLRGLAGAEIRLVWNRIAPVYQFEDRRAEVGDIQAAFIFGAMKLSTEQRPRPPVKMFLGNPIDLSFGRQFALLAGRMPGTKIAAVVRGNWLCLSWL